MTWQELTVPEFLNADIVNVEKLLRGQIDSYRLTKQFVHADGHRIWGDLSVGCQRKPDGDVDWFIAQINDTTNEVTLAQQLQRQNKLIRQQARADERFRRSMDSGAVAMCLVTPEGRFNQVNDAACRFFGLDARALAEMSFEDVTPPEYLDAERNNYKRLLEGQISSYRMVKHYVRPDGQVIWGDITVSPVLDENGRLEEIVGQIIDVTAEVQARQLLEAQNAENRMLAELLQKTNNRFKSELASAAAYLESIMPNGLQGPVAISSRYLPAQELGGDCFDYRWIDDDHLQFYLIDVSGHGLEPALLSVSVHNMLRSGSLSDQALLAPEMVLAELNRLFQMDGQHNHYFTAWYGVYERSTRTLRYANAGAPPAYAFTTAAGSAIRTTELTTKSTPIGLFDGTEFMTVIYSVPPGCRILLYSDGASEIALAGGGQLTLEGFKSLASRFAGSADWSIDRLVDKLRDLATGGVFEDDCSVIQISFD
jgi:sigma-B regulation protein RsbU (phosphoserine phosphatase)